MLISKITLSTGASSVVAGSSSGYVDGTGTTAQFSSPTSLDIASDGTYLWVADYGNNAIRQVVLSTGVVSTVRNVFDTFSKPQIVRFTTSGTAWIYMHSNVDRWIY